MRRRKRSIFHLILGILFALALGYLIYSYPPNFQFSLPAGKAGIFKFQIPVILIFFICGFSFLFFTFSFLFNHRRRGLFLGLIVSIFFLLRLLHLTQPFFTLLLIVFFGILELSFSKRP